MKRNFANLVLLMLCIRYDPVHACQFLPSTQNVAKCDYGAFQVWLSCRDRLAVLSLIPSLGVDTGKLNTSRRAYFLDEKAIPTGCQQTSSKTYATKHKGYDVGHLSAIDHFDDDLSIALKTNAMTNMVPQASKFNQTGAWKMTETLVECYRESHAPLTILSGVILGSKTDDDYFVASHGITRTPDYMWKLILGNSSYDAWIMRNTDESDVASLESSRRSIAQLIQTLELQKESIYEPVIDKLKELESTNLKWERFSYHSKCHLRKG
ncbi:DNA/RNA non-specific endonuclease [Rheinheimera sp.]|uniref:DNA/RNA non-specific endonuclease n=1 Tax=Rheinheimera sp. TaxID=1869214 RepID=UPI003D2D780F